MKWTIKKSLGAAFCAVGIIPALVVGYVNYRGFTKISATLRDSTKVHAVNVADKIDRNLFERYGDVQAFGINPAVQDRTNWYKVGSDKNAIVAAMNNYVALYGIYPIMILVDMSGKVIAVNDKSLSGDAINTSGVYRRSYDGTSWFRDSVEGEFYTSDEPGSLTGTVVEDYILSGEVTAAYPGHSGKVIGFSAPVKDIVTGETIAVWHNLADLSLVTEIATQFLSELEANTKLQSTAVAIFNQKGEMVLSHQLEGGKVSKNPAPAVLFDKGKLTSQLSRKSAPTSGIEDGRAVAAHHFSGALGFRGMPWTVAVSVDDAEITEASSAAVQLGLAVSGILAGILTGIIWWVLKSLVSPIEKAVVDLHTGSSELRSAAGQVSTSSIALAQGATEQAASLQSSSQSLEEISALSRQNTDSSQQAFALSDSAREASEASVKSTDSLMNAMHSIRQAADETAQIIKIIDEIAFQTNLLALNAAVEAARAGDAGKGFAVVAEEVRNLAQRSANAARETGDKIRHSKQLAQEGVDVAEEVARALDNIRQKVVQSASLVKEIAAASREQSAGINQVNGAIGELTTVTARATAVSQQTSSSAEELTAQASAFDQIIGRLLETVGHRGSRRQNVYQRSEISLESFRQKHSVVQNDISTPKVSFALKEGIKNEFQGRDPLIPKQAPTTVTSPVPAQNESQAQSVIPFDDDNFAGF
jgi:hypothetical protein